MESVRHVIVGAGITGLATAAALEEGPGNPRAGSRPRASYANLAAPPLSRGSHVRQLGTAWILGRTSVAIPKSGGYKLSALEIEEVLREHTAVAEAAEVGVPDDTWGERVVACVVARGASSRASWREARPRRPRSFAPYKVPKDFVLLDDLPRDAVGKVVKPQLVMQLRPRK